MTKKGKALELVVAWIQKSLHRGATVVHDDSVPDKDTGEPRQIDVSIRIPSGKEEFLAIVEVRDRKAKVDAPYVEQVVSKRASVGADAAFIVSKSGFTAPAIKKAGRHGVRTFTLDEASAADWGNWTSARTIGIVERKFGAPRVLMMDHGNKQPIVLQETTLDTLRADPKAKVIMTDEGAPHASIPDLIAAVVNHFTTKGLVEVPSDGSRVARSLIFQGSWSPPIFVDSVQGVVEIGWVQVDAYLWLETAEYPAKLRRFRKTTESGTESHAEFMEAETLVGGRKVTFQLLTETDGSCVRGGSILYLRHTAEESEDHREP